MTVRRAGTGIVTPCLLGREVYPPARCIYADQVLLEVFVVGLGGAHAQGFRNLGPGVAALFRMCQSLASDLQSTVFDYGQLLPARQEVASKGTLTVGPAARRGGWQWLRK